jgi:hypothetical protein
VIADFNRIAEKAVEDAIPRENRLYHFSLRFFEPQSSPVVFQDEAGY